MRKLAEGELKRQGDRIVVIADPVAPDGHRMRHCYWTNMLSDYQHEEYGLVDLDTASTVPDLTGTKLLLISWDSANGDAAFGSNRTLEYFQSQGRVEVEELVMEGGTVLCECQTFDGVPVQAAYDAIFGSHELKALSVVLREPERRGETCIVSSEYADHPLLLGMPPRLTANYRDNGERLFYSTFRRGDRQIEHLGEHYRSSLWWGWFTWWQKGWIPLLYADLPQSYVRRHGWAARPAAVLLAKVHRNGVLLASTMWIAGSQCQRLVDNVLRASPEAIAAYHRRAQRRRAISDIVVGVVTAALLVGILRMLILVTSSSQLSTAAWLLSIAGVGFIPFVTAAGHWYRERVWGRPYGYSMLTALIRRTPRGAP